MGVTAESQKLREVILKAIDDHVITRDEYDTIINTATADGVIDIQEQALLRELQSMIEDGSVKFVK